ncbi:MAG: TIGR03085 family protein, partial [Acidimicrobiaceae bacterium]|nr:TIGR03085 family protein [Acidimicrobiaceae bacterium]
QAERQGLADDFLRLGPEAETLCEGWTAADLAAHLVVRDRRPDAAAGILIGPLAEHTARVQALERDRWSWPELVERVRTGPPFPVRLTPIDAAINTLEYFVHHEDLLRGQPAALPRKLDPEFETLLWNRAKGQGRMLVRKAPVGVSLAAPGYGEATIRRRTPTVTVRGAPGELILWMFGRQRAAEVSFSGDELSIERLKQSRLGL